MESLDRDTIASLVGSRESRLSTTEFSFDQELINTRVYREMLARLAARTGGGSGKSVRSGPYNSSGSGSSERTANKKGSEENLIDFSDSGESCSRTSVAVGTPRNASRDMIPGFVHPDLDGLQWTDHVEPDVQPVVAPVSRHAEVTAREMPPVSGEQNFSAFPVNAELDHLFAEVATKSRDRLSAASSLDRMSEEIKVLEARHQALLQTWLNEGSSNGRKGRALTEQLDELHQQKMSLHAEFVKQFLKSADGLANITTTCTTQGASIPKERADESANRAVLNHEGR